MENDPVSMVIGKDSWEAVFDEKAQIGGWVQEGMYCDMPHWEGVKNFIRDVATLSYARGVEDSARVCDEYKAAHSSEHAKETKCSFLCHEAGRWTAANQAAAAIRSLIPNTPKV